jgi:ATP-dependent RNA helicase DDX5/DBP2
MSYGNSFDRAGGGSGGPRYQPYGNSGGGGGYGGGGGGGGRGRGGYSRGGGRGGARTGGYSNDQSHKYEEYPVFDPATLESFSKDFFTESNESKAQSEIEVLAFRKEHSLNITGTDVPR